MIKKILLFFDDGAEMQELQKSLKKIGFDCEGVRSLPALNERLLSFPADAILVSDRSGRVSVKEIADRLEATRSFRGKVVVLLPSLISNDELLQLRVDALIEENCPLEKLIRVLAHLLDLNAGGLIEKWNRQLAAAGSNTILSAPLELVELKDGPKPPAPSRAERFQAALQSGGKIDPTVSFNRKKIQEASALTEFETDQEIRDDKRAFFEKMVKPKHRL